MSNNIHTRLKLLREKEGLTQQEFASMLEISRDSYAQIERGKNNASVALLQKIVSIYKCSYSWLIDGEDIVVEDSGNQKYSNSASSEAIEILETSVKFLEEQIGRLKGK